MASDPQTTSTDASQGARNAPGLVAGRFALAEHTASRQGAEYYLGSDSQTGEPVIVKQLPDAAVSASVEMRLGHEARLLANAESKHISRSLGVYRENGDCWFASEAAPGTSLQGLGPLGLEEALAVGRGVLAGLRDLHALPVLHRNLRPDNVYVDGSAGSEAGVVLTDHGLCLAVEPDTPLKLQPLEVALYSSPEQAGSIDHGLSPASDLYSFGALLYYCLTGRTPFEGESVGAVLFKHMTESVPEMSRPGLTVPAVLENFVQRLLQKDPRDRYQSAEAALADLEKIAASIAGGDANPEIVLGATDKRASLVEPAFVARAEHMAALERVMQQAAEGSKAVASVEGESGAGKSRLLAELLRVASRKGYRVFRGIGASDVSSRPYRLLDGVVDGVVSEVSGRPDLQERLTETLGDRIGSIVEALPALAQAVGFENRAVTAPDETAEARTIEALVAFLEALGRLDKPTLILLDDCQWADELTIRLLKRLASKQPAEGADEPSLLVVLAFRSEEIPQDHLLREVRTSTPIELLPLRDEEVRQLAVSMAGGLPEQATETVIRLAGGSPFMASAVLRGLVECQAIRPTDAGWEVDPAALQDASSSEQAGSMLARRLQLLPEETTRFLAIGAVLGKNFELHVAQQLADLSAEEVINALESARERQLVWVRPDGAECVFFHDKIRTAVLQSLPDQALKEHHLRAARHFLQKAPHRVSDIAYHFDAGDRPEEAFDFAVKAAENARSQYALEIAEQQYHIALRGVPSAENRLQILEGLGDVLMLRGRYEEAGKWFEQASTLAGSGLPHAAIRGKIGELHFKRGDMGHAIQNFEHALRLQRERVPSTTVSVFAFLCWEVFVQVLHTWFPRLFVHRVKRRPDESERLTMRLLSCLAHGCWYSRKQMQMLWVHLRNMNMGERYLPSEELALTYSEHGPGLTILGYFSRGVRYAKKAIRMREELDDTWGKGQALVFLGITLFAASRFQECIESCRSAIRILEKLGDYWQIHMARYQIAASLYYLGDLDGAVTEAKLNRQSGVETGDEQASGIILDVWARAASGGIPPQVMSMEAKRERSDAQGACQVYLAEGICHIEDSEFQAAAEEFERALNTAAHAGVKNAYTLPPFTWRATALRMAVQTDGRTTPQWRRNSLREAARSARSAVRNGFICRNDLPQAYRELALIAAMQGRSRRAKKCFAKSLAYAHNLGERLQAAETLFDAHRVAAEAGWAGYEDYAERANRILADLGAAADRSGAPDPDGKLSLSLVDRFDTLLDTGRSIASSLDNDMIHSQAQEAALHLLRGEACYVWSVDQQGRLAGRDTQQSAPNAQFSPGLAQEAIENGRCVVLESEESADAASEGNLSELCVPIQVRGRVVSVLCVVHTRVRGLFGADEQRLAEFIAAIAGAALENAEGFAELQDLNITLEQRVADRTAAAETRAAQLAVSNDLLERKANELREAQDELQTAKQAAEQANEAKSRFLATMSHEIRTPMNGVLGMTELVLNTPLNDQQRNYLTTVKQSGGALLTLLNDILDLSKIEAGKMELESIPFSLRDVVTDAARLLAVPAFGKGIELICRIAPDVPEQVVGDPNCIRQIVVNLVSNAVKFTAEGHVLVRIERAVADGGGVALRFAVEDTGIGIAKDKVGVIFDAFRQEDSSTTRRYGGTGLGLAISMQLTELMGGKIWLESEEGRGSTFHLEIPFEVEAEAAEDNTAADEGPTAEGLRVGIATEAPALLPVYEDLLADCCVVETVSVGTGGCPPESQDPESRPRSVDVTVVDVAIGELSDIDRVRKRLKDLGEAGGPIVAALPAGNVEIVECCRVLGLQHTVMKPAKRDELVDAMLAATGVGGRRTSAQPTASISQEGRSLRVLVADDSPVNQEVAKGLLGLMGHEAELADDGLQAVDAFRCNDFDVVLMDIEMPQLDGFAATKQIRAWEAETGQPKTPILALSAHVTPQFTQKCNEADMDGHLTKPVQPEVLSQALVEIASQSTSSTIPEQTPFTPVNA